MVKHQLVCKMTSQKEKEDIEDFIRKIDELDAVLKSENAQELKPTDSEGQNRTVINKDAFKDENCKTSSVDNQILEQQAFLKGLEADAAARAKRRKEKTKIATKLKEDGNKAFKEGDYERAISLYSEGLEHLKDMTVLYTNRAQAHNHLNNFQEAIRDCDTALLLEEACSKAFIHKGKALVGLKRYEDGIKCYEELLKHKPSQKKLVEEYVTAAVQAKEAAESEAKAMQVFQEGSVHATNVVQVLEKLKREGKPTVYYGGGLGVLADMLRDDTSRTLFRTKDGWNVFSENRTISRSLEKACNGSKARDILELVLWALDLIDRAITNNDENLKCFLSKQELLDMLPDMMQSQSTAVALKCTLLLLKISYKPHRRTAVVSNIDSTRLLVSLLKMVESPDSSSNEAAKLLTNLALEKKFILQFRDKFGSEVLPAVIQLMQKSSNVTASVLPSCFSFLGNMAHDPLIRKGMCKSKEFWKEAVEVLKSYESQFNVDVIYAFLGLLVNVAIETSEALKDQSAVILTYSITLLNGTDSKVSERAMTLISRVLPQSEEAMFVAGRKRLAEIVMKYIEDADEDIIKPAIKILAVLTQSDEESRTIVVEQDEGLRHLQRLIKKNDDLIIANTALCLSNCVAVPGVSHQLVKSDIIKLLLTKTDTSNGTIKQNCAITLAKLATTNETHLERLRDLGGIGILHSCMKHVK